MDTIYSIGGVFFGVIVMMMVGVPLLKNQLVNIVAGNRSLAMLTEVTPGRAKLKIRGGQPISVIRGADGAPKKPSGKSWWHYLWWCYSYYIYSLTGLHVFIPFFERIYTYDLPRYRISEEDGVTLFKSVEANDPGYRTDHVRIELTTWYFEFGGIEIETVPFMVKGSVQIRILPGREVEALFKTDSWNTLLTQALNSVVRRVARDKATLDLIIGSVSQDIWEEGGGKEDEETYGVVQQEILNELKEHTIDYDGEEKTLEALIGLNISRVDIIDFVPEVTPEQQSKIIAPALGRQEARERAIAGEGEAAFQSKVNDAAAKSGEVGLRQIEAQALIQASEAGQVNAILAAWTKNMMRSS